MIEDHPDYRTLSRDARVRARVAVRRMMREGVAQDQAVAKAMSMARAGRLDDEGRYMKMPEVTS